MNADDDNNSTQYCPSMEYIDPLSPPSLHSLFWSRDSSSLSEKYSIGIQYCYQTHDWIIKQNKSQQYPINIYKWPIQAKVFCRLEPIVLVCSYSIWLSGCFWLITTQVSCFLCFSPVRGCPPCGRSLMCVWLLADALLRGGRVGQHLHLSRFSVLVDQTANCPILSSAAINHSTPQKTIFIAIIVMMVIEPVYPSMINLTQFWNYNWLGISYRSPHWFSTKLSPILGFPWWLFYRIF